MSAACLKRSAKKGKLRAHRWRVPHWLFQPQEMCAQLQPCGLGALRVARVFFLLKIKIGTSIRNTERKTPTKKTKTKEKTSRWETQRVKSDVCAHRGDDEMSWEMQIRIMPGRMGNEPPPASWRSAFITVFQDNWKWVNSTPFAFLSSLESLQAPFQNEQRFIWCKCGGLSFSPHTQQRKKKIIFILAVFWIISLPLIWLLNWKSNPIPILHWSTSSRVPLHIPLGLAATETNSARKSCKPLTTLGAFSLSFHWRGSFLLN